MSKLIEKLRKREVATTEQAHKAYRGLVAKLADDVAVSEEQAADVCDRVGATVDQLEADVLRVQERKHLAAILAGKEAAATQREQATSDLAAEVERFASIEAEHERACDSLQAMIRDADQRIADGEAACRSLVIGATDPDVLAERDALVAKREALDAESVATRQQIGHLESALSVNLRQSEEFAGKELPDAVHQQKRKLKALQDRLRDLNTETVAADAAVRTFERNRLTDPAA